MGIGRFFRKIETGGKNFFKKGGIAESGLRKMGNSLSQVAPIVSKAGEIAGQIAPALKAVPGIGGQLALGASKFADVAPKLSKGIKSVGGVSKDVLNVARQNRGDVGGIVSGSLDSVKSAIQAPRPQKQTTNLFDELPFA
jgi:hypothetical protein